MVCIQATHALGLADVWRTPVLEQRVKVVVLEYSQLPMHADASTPLTCPHHWPVLPRPLRCPGPVWPPPVPWPCQQQTGCGTGGAASAGRYVTSDRRKRVESGLRVDMQRQKQEQELCSSSTQEPMNAGQQSTAAIWCTDQSTWLPALGEHRPVWEGAA
jgi:hypothetical protein